MPPHSLGIIGGGQLAQMLVEASTAMGLGEVWVLDQSGPRCPAGLVGARVEAQEGAFFAPSRTVIFENEFVDCSRLEAWVASGNRFIPGLDVIRRLQDKLSQKCALQELGIATSPFAKLSPQLSDGTTLLDPADQLRRLAERFPQGPNGPNGMVLKWARQGYDGKGVCLLGALDSESELARARRFCEDAARRGVGLFAEERVDYRRELAVVACRSSTGQFAAYPLVESQQRDGVCHWVRGPVGDPRLESEAQGLARRFGEGVGCVGTFALEFFETTDGRLLVNEVAPRVHNTGHFTQDAAETSQFENHWRAILGLELGPMRARASFAMLNLLGPPGLEAELAASYRVPSSQAPLFPHWYGKTSVRPGRKLGHVNAYSDEPGAVPRLVKQLEAWHAEWEQGLRLLKKELTQ